MRRKLLSTGTALAIAAVVLTVAGCGGSSKSSSSTKTTAPATTTAAAATTSAATTPAGGSSFASASNCQQLADVVSKLGTAFTGTADLSSTISFFKALATKAPAAIRSDFATLADAFGKIGAALKGIQPGQTPTAAQLAKLQALQGQLDVKKLTGAAQHLSTWAAQNCHA